MTDFVDEIALSILEVVETRGPVGWYAIEHVLKIPRSEFPQGYSVIRYLGELEKSGLITHAEGKGFEICKPKR